MIAEEIIAEIRSRADIVAVIGQHVQLKKAGRNWKGLCPFHGEKTPSFNVQPDKGYYYCFGCQKKGDVFNFVMELEGKSFVEAAEQLGARFGIEVPKIDESPELRRARGERIAMLEINKHAMMFFREVLADPRRGEAGRAYLAKRGINQPTTDKFQLGYAPADWHALADYLKEKKCDLELAAKLGLVAKQPRAGGYYDRYRDRLVCPVIDTGTSVVGFSARVLGNQPPAPDGSEPPKYINSPESIVYKKSQQLFGLYQAREGMQKNGRAVLVEGNFDVISLHQAEFTDVVAPLGTALTSEQVLKLKRLANRIVLLYDGDKAGYKATMHALQLCVEADVEVLVASRPGNARSGGAGPLSGGVDPDSLVASGGAEQLKEAIDRAQGGIEFFCFEVWSKARSNSDARARALEDAAKLVARIENPTKRDLVVDTFAKALSIEPGIVQAAVGRALAARGIREDRNVPAHIQERARTGQDRWGNSGDGKRGDGKPWEGKSGGSRFGNGGSGGSRFGNGGSGGSGGGSRYGNSSGGGSRWNNNGTGGAGGNRGGSGGSRWDNGGGGSRWDNNADGGRGQDSRWGNSGPGGGSSSGSSGGSRWDVPPGYGPDDGGAASRGSSADEPPPWLNDSAPMGDPFEGAPPPDDSMGPPPDLDDRDAGGPGDYPGSSPGPGPSARGEMPPREGDRRENSPGRGMARTLDPEVEVLSLLADHPSLLTTTDADRVSSLLTEPRLRAMYSAARAGQSFLELASMHLPPATAQLVLSGKYAEAKDPPAKLAALVGSLEQRRTMLAQRGLGKSLAAAQRGGADKELVRLQAQLAVAQRKGDQELIDQLLAQIESNRKQAE